MAVFATDRLVVDRLLALRRPKEDRAEKQGEGREDDGFWPLLAVKYAAWLYWIRRFVRSNDGCPRSFNSNTCM